MDNEKNPREEFEEKVAKEFSKVNRFEENDLSEELEWDEEDNEEDLKDNEKELFEEQEPEQEPEQEQFPTKRETSITGDKLLDIELKYNFTPEEQEILRDNKHPLVSGKSWQERLKDSELKKFFIWMRKN